MEKSLNLNQYILEYQTKKVPKYKQTIWLLPEVFYEIVKISSQYSIAPNVIISAIVTAFVKNIPFFVKEKEKVVEKIVPQVEKLVYFCALCEQVFENSSDLRIHLIKCRNNFIQKLNKN